MERPQKPHSLFRKQSRPSRGRWLSTELQQALIGAAESPPDRRDWWSDKVAVHGIAAIEALADWLQDSDLHRFALDTIVLTAERGGQTAAGAAKSVLDAFDARHLPREQMAAFGRAQGRVDALVRGGPTTPQPARLTNLVAGRLYRRRQLHSSGLGGNQQKGISYPASGRHALLFSGGLGREVYGYEDRWEGDDFVYYGEWSGGGDMTMTGGNAAIVDRSPHLYVFTGQTKGVTRFEGRFEYVKHFNEWTKREGKQARAIVFRLRKVADRVEV